ncbi:phenylalanine--tRNA ligase subunit beta [Sphingomonas sp. ASV193]|uniref:phenylalanine--tRNA ligase subunit beta n=1 Tax=Sphingomonas sp. ASV193 TaxID=3144405 RepID=UPI0032E88195
MKFTYSWLKEHLDTDAAPSVIAERLTSIGLEVESVTNPAELLGPFRIARVLSAAPHPQADKLQVLSVDAGDGPMQVVCGAPNAREGLVGVFGGPGTYVPGPAFTLGKATIRGVESNGMMCSARELQLGEDHDGIIELPADAPVGAGYAEWAGLDDALFDIAVTPNRQDCMGVRGIARDLAAAGLGTLRPLHEVYRQQSLDPVAGEAPGPDVRTEDSEGCPAFYAQAVRGLTNGPSPDWLQKKLKAVGQKPISVLVDITNLITLDLGRPLHVYDAAKLDGGLVARRARAGESVLALNGRTYALDETMTVIADASKVHDIGGIMGGEESGVSAETTDVIIECAWFDPERIALTGQRLTLTSDARQRFERGVDPAFLDEGLSLATRLVLDHTGGAASGVTRAGTPPVSARTISFDPARTAALGGVEVPEAEQRAILERLGFGVAGDWTVTVPSWRRDVSGPADLVEEVVRMVGTDAIPSTPLPRPDGVARPTATRAQAIERKMRRTAAARGLDEAVTWSFIAASEAAAFGGGAFTIANPISEEMKVMRPSLLPGLAAAARRNRDRGAASIRLFEIGRRYLAEGEKPTLTLLLAGDKRARGWQAGKAARFNAFDAKAEAVALLEAAGAPVASLQLTPGAGEAWHPGRSASLRLGKAVLANFGEIHPALAKTLDLPTDTVAAEIFLDAIPAARAKERARVAFTPPALQAVTRDYAFTVPLELSADALVRAVRGADKAAITDARLFDRYDGGDALSLAIEVTMQPGEKSFTEAELAAISERIVAAAAKLGAALRG